MSDEANSQNFLLPPTLVMQPRPLIVGGKLRDYEFFAQSLLELASKAQAIDKINVNELYDPKEDYNWFISGEVDVSSYRGKYIAIWKKQIVANGDTAIEVERLAKFYHGENSKPAIVYVPKKEDTIL